MSAGYALRRWGLVGIAGSVVLTGCSLPPGDGRDAGPGAGSSAPTTATTPAAPDPVPSPSVTVNVPSSLVSPWPSAAPTPTPSSASPGAGRGLPVSSTRIRGRVASASWDVAIPVFSGPPAAGEVNRRVRAAVDDLIARVRREAREDGGVERTLSGEGRVTTNDGRTVQVTIGYLDFLAGTARPASFVTTTVVDVRRSRPVRLDQVLQNPAEGLRFLGGEVTKVARNQGETVDPKGLAPRIANYANWQGSSAGLTFYFPEYQLGGAGIRAYTVPWARARLVLSAYGEKLLR